MRSAFVLIERVFVAHSFPSEPTVAILFHIAGRGEMRSLITFASMF